MKCHTDEVLPNVNIAVKCDKKKRHTDGVIQKILNVFVMLDDFESLISKM